MIDARFSAPEFEELGRDSPEADELAKELAAAIAEEMAKVVEPGFNRIATELIALGHKLSPESVDVDAEYDSRGYTFRDVGNDRGIFDHKLRIHFDTQVCTGYPNEITEQEAIFEYLGEDA